MWVIVWVFFLVISARSGHTVIGQYPTLVIGRAQARVMLLQVWDLEQPVGVLSLKGKARVRRWM